MYGSETHETGLPDEGHRNRSTRFAVFAMVAILSERVPAGDFDGDPRPEDVPAGGFDERP
jgi:hypothetical protein